MVPAELDWLASKGLRGWDLVVIGIIIIITTLIPFIVPLLSRKVLKDESKKKIDELIKEKSIVIDENNSSINMVISQLEKIEVMLEETKKERGFFDNTNIERLDVITNRLNDLTSRLDDLTEIVADHEEQSNNITADILENKLFSEAFSPFRRLKAYRMLLAMGINGRVKTKGYELVQAHKETWLDVLDTTMDVEIVNEDYYNKVLKEINEKLFN